MQNAKEDNLLQSQQSGAVEQVLKKIEEIVLIANEGNYLFRGEPKCYEVASSGLYRKHRHLCLDARDIDLIEQQIVNRARRFTTETDELKILSQLQHYGYRTNFIDFTTDYNIALFFACDGYFDVDGRILFLGEIGPFEVVAPSGPQNRVISQKSRFVRPDLGFVEPNRSVSIPHFLKKHILRYLSDYHGMTSKSIYNDIHGFIRYSDLHAEASEEFDRGVAQAERGSPAKAIVHFTEAIRLNPRFAAAYANRAAANYQIGRYDHALRDSNESISIEVESDSAYNIRGLIYRKRGQKDLAMQDYNRVIELFPTQHIGHYNRGLLHHQNGDYSYAIKDFSHAIELNPAYSRAYTSRGMANNKLRRFPQAIRDFTMAIELGTIDGAAFLHRGYARYSQQEYDLAILDYSEAIELNHSLTETFSFRGNAYFFQGDLRASVDDCTQSIQLDPNYATAYFNRGNALFALGELEAAAGDYTKAIEIDPYNYDALLNRGAIQMEKHRLTTAIQDFSSAVEIAPENVEAYFRRCVAWLIGSEYTKALSDINKLKELRFDVVSELNDEFGGTEQLQEKLGVRFPLEILDALNDRRKPILLGRNDARLRGIAVFPKE